MGQPISVVRKPSSTAGVVRFEINRTLTGTGHEGYANPDDIVDDRPPDELARRLFAAGGVRAVYLYGNQITVEVEPGANTEGFDDVIRELYIHYKPGVTPSVTG